MYEVVRSYTLIGLYRFLSDYIPTKVYKPYTSELSTIICAIRAFRKELLLLGLPGGLVVPFVPLLTIYHKI